MSMRALLLPHQKQPWHGMGASHHEIAKGTFERRAAGGVSPERVLPLKIPPILLEGDAPSPAPIPADPKFVLGGIPEAKTGTKDPKLPESYGTGRLWLAACDPHCLYAHWDFALAQKRQFHEQAALDRLTLRVHLETLASQPLLEVRLPSTFRHGFIEVPLAGRKYVAELGFMGPDSSWQLIAGSEEVSTPSQGVAADQPVQFATIPAVSRTATPESLVQTVLAQSSPTALEKQFPLPPLPQRTADIPQAGTTDSTAIPQPTRDIPAAHAVSAKGGLPMVGLTLLRPGSCAVPDWDPTQEEALARLVEWSLVPMDLANSATIVELLRGKLVSVPGMPLDISRPSEAPTSFVNLPPAQETTSPFGGEAPRRQGFWLSVNAELVIYGATEPAAEVSIGGRPIQLRPDGTFSYRFALPDGRYELPIVAASAQGDLRSAVLTFQRHSRYVGDVQPHAQGPDLKSPDAANLS